MSLRDFLTATMIAQGQILTKPAPHGVADLVQSDVILVAVGERVTQATVLLVHAEERAGSIKGEVGKLTQELLVDDALGDGIIGAEDELTAGAVALCEDPHLREALVETREVLFGEGGRARYTQAPYGALGGEAEQMTARLQPKHWEALSKVRVGDVSAADGLRRWLVIAQGISDKESQRAQLRTKTDENAVERAEIVKLRNAWIRAMNTFVSAVELSDLSAADRERILAPLREADQKATEARLRKSAEPVAATPAPTTPAGDAAP